MTDVINHYINGRIVEGKSGNFGDVYNPALGEVIRRCAYADEGEVRAAVAAAKDAFPAWAAIGLRSGMMPSIWSAWRPCTSRCTRNLRSCMPS